MIGPYPDSGFQNVDGGVCRWACRVDPRYHVVLAVKVCALAGRALAACGRLRTLTAALRRGAPVSGNPARHRPEFAMSLSSTSSVVAVDALLVRDVDGQYLSDGMWFLTRHKRWGLLKSHPDYLAVARQINQVDLYTQAASQLKVGVPKDAMRSSKLIDGVVWDGKDPAKYADAFKVNAAAA
jgi:hypothetical protein